jgi:ferrous iron transport protein B
MKSEPANESPSHSSIPAVALVGNPNTGKSSIFNALCGMNTRIGNFPGVTVEKKIGKLVDSSGEISVIDLPGTYSLSARSIDEQVSVEVLLGVQADIPKLAGVIVIVDATNLDRNLYLFSQIRDMQLPMLLVLNMWDRVEQQGMEIDLEAVRRQIDVPIVTTSASKRIGIDELKLAVRRLVESPRPEKLELFPAAFLEQTEKIRNELEKTGRSQVPDYIVRRALLDVGGTFEKEFVSRYGVAFQDVLQQARDQLAEKNCKVPAIETRVRYAWIRKQLNGLVQRNEKDGLSFSDRLDRVLTHRFFGLLIFTVLMLLIFQAIYSWYEPMKVAIEFVLNGAVSSIEGMMPPGALRSLLVDGIFAGLGAVLVFLPQIMLLFGFIAIMEDCGYMARAAFVMDKIMTKVGLSGKSFLPLMSSFACAVPGIMATRVIENWRDRMVTILIAPLMSCSARLPVYFLLVSAFVPNKSYLGGWLGLQTIVLFGMHILGAVVAIPIAAILKKWFFPGEIAPFVMELPTYKWPSLRVILHRVWERAWAFLQSAGTLILCTTIVIWAAGYFPGDHTRLNDLTRQNETIQQKIEQSELQASETSNAANDELRSRSAMLVAELNTERSRLIESSFLGRAGKWIEPIVRPLGWDWRIGVGVIASFPAREVVVATLGTIYSLGAEAADSDDGDSPLTGALVAAKWPDGRPVYTLPVALSIMVFFALCAQCGATLMVIRRETNSWRWPIFTFVYMTTLAYIGAFIVSQAATRLGW